MPAQMSPVVDFGEWTPDTLNTFEAGSVVATNVLTQGKYYRPFSDFGSATDSLPSTCYGGFYCRDGNGNVYVFAATQTKLYQLSGSSWNDVSGATYNTPDDGYWEFAIFGNRVLATNLTDNIQSFVIGTDSTFSDLTGSPPKCRSISVVNNFVLLCGVDGYTQRVQWSALNNPTDWTPSASTQSDYNDILGDGGKVQAVVGSQNVAIVFMEREIWRMDYVGPDTIFNFVLIEKSRGTVAPRSVTSTGININYLGEDGFYSFDGQQSLPIGYGKVDRYFYGRVDSQYISNRIIGITSIDNKTSFWCYPNAGDGTSGVPTHMMAYNNADGRFTEIEQSCNIILEGLTSSFTMEQLGTLYGTMEAVPFSLDSPVWQGGKNMIAAVDTSDKFGFFDGDNKAATITSSETQLNTGGLATVQSVVPVTDGASFTTQIGSRFLLSDAITYTATSTRNSSTGECNFLNTSRYHRVQLNLTGTWTLARGIQFRFTKAGMR